MTAPIKASQLIAGTDSYGRISVLRRGVVRVSDDRSPGGSRVVDLNSLNAEENAMFERELESYYRKMYPVERVSEIAARSHLVEMPERAKPSLRTRLKWLTYPLRARLASWLVGWDVTEEDSDSDGDDS